LHSAEGWRNFLRIVKRLLAENSESLNINNPERFPTQFPKEMLVCDLTAYGGGYIGHCSPAMLPLGQMQQLGEQCAKWRQQFRVEHHVCNIA